MATRSVPFNLKPFRFFTLKTDKNGDKPYKMGTDLDFFLHSIFCHYPACASFFIKYLNVIEKQSFFTYYKKTYSDYQGIENAAKNHFKK